jgi:hypothetical protein
MPQTVEAIDHAKAAEVPIVVAVNKIDKEDANPERVRGELVNQGLQPRSGAGRRSSSTCSAKAKQNLDQLLEMLLLQADVLELKANPKAEASGVIIESRLTSGRGRSRRCSCSAARCALATRRGRRCLGPREGAERRTTASGSRRPGRRCRSRSSASTSRRRPASSATWSENDRVARQMAQKRAQRIAPRCSPAAARRSASRICSRRAGGRGAGARPDHQGRRSGLGRGGRGRDRRRSSTPR